MAEALTIARPYAEAIFKLATAKGASNNNTLQAWHDMLNLAATVAADGQEPPIRSATWLARYHHDMQGVLLAELDLRLQPIEGMMEALRHETTS